MTPGNNVHTRLHALCGMLQAALQVVLGFRKKRVVSTKTVVHAAPSQRSNQATKDQQRSQPSWSCLTTKGLFWSFKGTEKITQPKKGMEN